LRWLREAAQHAEQVEEVLMADFKVKRGQLDALWTYVGNRGKKGLPRDREKRRVLAFNLYGYRQPLTGRS